MKERYDLEKMNSPEEKKSDKRKAKGKLRRKSVSFLVILVIAVIAASSATIAFIVDKTAPATNVFTKGSVTNTVIETFEDNVKNDVSIKNTGNTTAYIRAEVLVNYVSDDGNIYAVSPTENVDYTIIYTTDTSWKKGTDGFWYYIKPVAANENTSVLINEAKASDGALLPDGYSLSVEIIASSIQASPASAVTSSWSSGVNGVSDDGTLSIIG